MEPINREINIMPGIFGGIIQAENIPLQELPKQYNLVVEENKLIKEQLEAISFIYDLSRSHHAELQEGLKKSVNVDIDYTNGITKLNEALAKENGNLLAKIAFLENRERESSAAYESQLIAAHQNIDELENYNASIKSEIEILELCVNDVGPYPKEFVDYCTKIYKQAEEINKGLFTKKIIPLQDFNLAQMSRHSAAQLTNILRGFNFQVYMNSLKSHVLKNNYNTNTFLFDKIYHQELIEDPSELKKFCKIHNEALINLNTLFY